MNDAATPAPLGRLNVPKASDVLADRLRSRIRSGELQEGGVLPSERDLVVQTGLSRTSVREALRLLEVEGLIDIRPGRNGGSRVRRPAGDELARHLDLFIWGRDVSVEDLHDVREALEALGAEGAALRRTDAELAALVAQTQAVEAAVGDIGRYLEANLAWHMAVVRASHNELLISIMNALSNAIHEATAIEAFDSPEVWRSTLEIHRRILEAISARDAPAARRRMARHVAAARRVAEADPVARRSVPAVGAKHPGAAAAARAGARPGPQKRPAEARPAAARSAPARPALGRSKAAGRRGAAQ